MEFTRQKKQRLEHVDLSRKGSVDDALKDVVELINAMPQYFTTSSCSGRIILFENETEGRVVQKRGCKWLHVSHDHVHVANITDNMQELTGEAVFKFEPMVMHMQCRTLEDAQNMHQAAVAAGFRNSGITVGNKGKIMMAVRGTHSLEAPLSSGGEILVSQQYIEYLTESANLKMKENFARIQRFYENVKLLWSKAQSLQSDKSSKKQKEVKTELKIPHTNVLESSQSEERIDQGLGKLNTEDPMALFMFEDT